MPGRIMTYSLGAGKSQNLSPIFTQNFLALEQLTKLVANFFGAILFCLKLNAGPRDVYVDTTTKFVTTFVFIVHFFPP